MGRRARTKEEEEEEGKGKGKGKDERGQRPAEVHIGAEPGGLCSKYYTFNVFSWTQ